jgi:hypothetical protein
VSGRRWLVSAYIVWHLFAVFVRAIPHPEKLPKPHKSRSEASLVGPVSGALDRAAEIWAPVPALLWRLTAPLRPPVDLYISIASLSQTWSMFGNPPRWDQYVRVRFYIKPETGREWMATQLVFPHHREDELRLLQSFRDSYLDKAIAIAFDEFHVERKPELIKPDTQPSELPASVAPIGRYYARQFAKRLEGTGQRIVRIEVWEGRVNNPLPGSSLDPAVLAARRAALETYYEGVVEHHLNVPPYPPYHGGEREADIEWLLEYFEEP